MLEDELEEVELDELVELEVELDETLSEEAEEEIEELVEIVVVTEDELELEMVVVVVVMEAEELDARAAEELEDVLRRRRSLMLFRRLVIGLIAAEELDEELLLRIFRRLKLCASAGSMR